MSGPSMIVWRQGPLVSGCRSFDADNEPNLAGGVLWMAAAVVALLGTSYVCIVTDDITWEWYREGT